MPDVTYVFKKAKRTCAAYAQRQAILWPLMGRRSKIEKDVLEDTKELLVWWRAKALALSDAGWPDLSGGRLQFARNCPPQIALATTEKPCRCCNLAFLCPWCAARDVSRLFEALGTFLPSRGAISDPVRLLEVRNSFTMTPKAAGILLTSHLRAFKEAPKRLFRSVANKGGYYTVTFQPRTIKRRRIDWLFSYRALMIVDSDLVVSEDDLTDLGRKFKITEVYSKRQLIPPVARTCRYPVGLMRSDEEYVITALNARRGFRCKASLGCLRNLEKSEEL